MMLSVKFLIFKFILFLIVEPKSKTSHMLSVCSTLSYTFLPVSWFKNIWRKQEKELVLTGDASGLGRSVLLHQTASGLYQPWCEQQQHGLPLGSSLPVSLIRKQMLRVSWT